VVAKTSALISAVADVIADATSSGAFQLNVMRTLKLLVKARKPELPRSVMMTLGHMVKELCRALLRIRLSKLR
jgi:hypothetical protein